MRILHLPGFVGEIFFESVGSFLLAIGKVCVGWFVLGISLCAGEIKKTLTINIIQDVQSDDCTELLDNLVEQ